MSELKEHLFVPYSELQEGDELTDAITIAKPYYLKSEVDPVIAELKHQRDGAFGLTNSNLTLDDLSQMARKEIDRQKYKRCLAIADWCKSEYEHRKSLSDKEQWYWRRWYIKWLELAEKLKETKR